MGDVVFKKETENGINRRLALLKWDGRMFGFWWRTKKRAGEICSVFDIRDFCQYLIK